MTDTVYADDLAFPVNTLALDIYLLHSLQKTLGVIGPYGKAK